MYRPDVGKVVLEGRERSFASPFDAIRAGVAVIYQELHLVPEMTVAEVKIPGVATPAVVNGTVTPNSLKLPAAMRRPQ